MLTVMAYCLSFLLCFNIVRARGCGGRLSYDPAIPLDLDRYAADFMEHCEGGVSGSSKLIVVV